MLQSLNVRKYSQKLKKSVKNVDSEIQWTSVSNQNEILFNRLSNENEIYMTKIYQRIERADPFYSLLFQELISLSKELKKKKSIKINDVFVSIIFFLLGSFSFYR